MNAWTALVIVAGMATLCYLGPVFERWVERREHARRAEPASKPWTEPRQPTVLETGEQAALAHFAVRYASGDRQAGVKLADYMRIKHPGVSDTEIARMLIGLHHVGRSFGRTQHDGLAAYLQAMGSAALHLTELERQDAPR